MNAELKRDIQAWTFSIALHLPLVALLVKKMVLAWRFHNG